MNELKALKAAILAKLTPGIRIGIASHVEPDGDGFCASLALQILLRQMGFDSEIVIDDSDLERFSHLMEGSEIRPWEPGLGYDLLFVLDCNSRSRLGDRAELLARSEACILIDHHEAENGLIAADFSFIEPAFVSVGAILWSLFSDEIRALPDQARLAVGNCLYTTILNDTNNYANANTKAEVFRISAELTELGIVPSRLYQQYFLNHSPREMRYVGEVLSTIELLHSDRILFMHSTLEMLNRNRLRPDAIMNITRWVQGVKGVDALVYFREEKVGLYKLSLRSVNYDVNKIAVRYGGGGHRQASGMHLTGSLDAIKAQILKDLVAAFEGKDA
jgi:phosphoesterase RecJ-like protein